MKTLIQENEGISRLNKSLNKKLKEIQEHSLKENKEFKDKILSFENNLKDSNQRLGVLKVDIELRDHSLDCVKRLENVLTVKLSEHENQERVLNDKLNEVNKVISKISSSFNKVETLIKIEKHPSDKRGLGYVNEKITPSTNKPIFVKASSKLNVGTLSNRKAIDATGEGCPAIARCSPLVDPPLVGKTVKIKEADYALENINNLTQVVPEIWVSKSDGGDQRINRTRSEMDLVLTTTSVGA
ncbi:hypothetical protein Dsin_009396 [Dipteronia sinensis]|uniref:Uncharacterized protein n=1 Tax=Dipteronia sinensis TaxID=43782 RepID=A0AAE0AQH2_9ROSI|nr:hypothetical protein Dsin_009396 [Dipteronia sinensis]